MSKIICLFCSIIALLGCVGYNLLNDSKENTTFLRIHIVGDNSVNYEEQVIENVRDILINYLTPKLQNCKDVEDALIVTIKELGEVKKLVNDIVLPHEDNCDVNVNVTNEFFPDRMYGNYYVSSGYFDALTVSLGQANGENWWCVLYPPLCYKGFENKIVYTSKIWDIISRQ
jgi:stage II sporulation protein R